MHFFPLLNRIRRSPFSSLTSASNLIGNTERLGENSFVNLGRNYEEKCKKVLSKIFDEPIRIVGGANDGGIDLLWCKTFDNESAVEFVGQCKVKFCNRVAPEVCRALDGVLSRRKSGTVGCLISNFRPSVKAIKSIEESSFPQIYFNISDCFACEYVKEIIVNQKFKEKFPNLQILTIRGLKYKHYILKFK